MPAPGKCLIRVNLDYLRDYRQKEARGWKLDARNKDVQRVCRFRSGI